MQTKDNNHIWRKFVKYASLNVMGMIGLSCYILADTFFIARSLGTVGLTALNLALPIFGIVNGLGLMIGMGGATRYSIWGKGAEQSRRDTIFSQSVYLCVGISIVLCFLGALFSSQLATLLGADLEVHALCTTYLQIVLIFAPAFMLNHTLICFVRNDRNPKLAMAAMLIGSFSNIILDYVFIFPLDMGMFGAALATGVAPLISIAILSIHALTRKNGAKLIVAMPNRGSTHDVVALGASSLIGELSSGVVIIVFNMAIMAIGGNVAVAAYGVIANLALVVVAMFTGIAQGIQPLISKYYGSGEHNIAKKTYWYGVGTAALFSVVIYALTAAFSSSIVSVFNKDADIVLAQIATSGLKIYFVAFVFVGINIITAVYFSSIDKPKQSFLVSILRGFVLIIPVTIVLASAFGLTGVWLSVPVTESVVSVVAMYCMWSISHRKTALASGKSV